MDIDQDNDLDILLIGEWTDIQYMKNENNTFTLHKLLPETPLTGWWNVIKKVDLDNDGKEDILLGNLGENYKYKATENEPFEVYSNDMNGDSKNDIILGYHIDDKLFPVRGFQCSSEQMPDLKDKIHSYKEFGSSDIFQIYGERLNDALHYKANNFKSGVLWNQGAGKFEFKPLNYIAQLAPVQSFETFDFDKDGDWDIIGAGNWFVSEIETPRADNGQGFILENLGNKTFKALSYTQTGLLAKDDVRNMVLLDAGTDHPKLVIANNNAKAQLFKFQ
jgi:hypothetical protein